MKIINGDIFKVAKKGVIMHQTNCIGAMGAGIALHVKMLFPNVYYGYQLLCQKHKENIRELLGHVQIIKVGEDLYIANSFTQLVPGSGKQTNEELLIENIKTQAKAAREKGLTLYIPYKIGCGLAGGDWAKIEAAIKDVDVTIVKYDC